MAVSRWDPFRDLMSIQGELNQLFGRAFSSESEAARGASWAPALDVFEDKDRFVIKIELAGLGPRRGRDLGGGGHPHGVR
jgi:HSP20 family protein